MSVASADLAPNMDSSSSGLGCRTFNPDGRGSNPLESTTFRLTALVYVQNRMSAPEGRKGWDHDSTPAPEMVTESRWSVVARERH